MISTVYIAKNIYGGDGLGRLGDGRVIFVPGAWAGEQVRAEIVEEKKHFVKARLVEVVEPSAERIAPDPSRTVPGMVYSCLGYRGELEAKEQQLLEFFERARVALPSDTRSLSLVPCPRISDEADHLRKIPSKNLSVLSAEDNKRTTTSSPTAVQPSTSNLRPVLQPSTSDLQSVVSGGQSTNRRIDESTNSPALHYRNKVVYHFAKRRGNWVIGYLEEPSHEIVDVLEDPLARPEINAKIGEIRRAVVTLLTTGPVPVRKDIERKGKVTIRWTKKTGVKWWIGEAPSDLVLKETTAGLDFEVPAGGFYQVNPEVGEALVREVVAGIAAQPTKKLLDLYCGVGVFGLCALKALTAAKPSTSNLQSASQPSASNLQPSLIGIESGRQAIEFAKKNAASLKVEGAKFFAEEVGRNLRRIPVGPETTVIVDPPRDGLEPGVAKWLAASRAPVIYYVSCDPATLMRDLKELAKAYEVERVRWFNMFPRTARFETLVVLKRKTSWSVSGMTPIVKVR